MIYLLIPLLFLSVGVFLYEPVSLLSSSILIFYIIFLFVFKKRINIKKQYNLFIPILIPVTYCISSIINHQSLSSSLLGGFGRNIGLSTLIAFSLVFIYFSVFVFDTNRILFSFFTTLVFANIYGYLQYFDLDPINWLNPYSSITLTLGNPNFSGALFGMLTISTVYFLFTSKNSINKLMFLLLGISSVFLSFKTNSLQAVLLIFLSIFVFMLVISLNNSNKKFRLKRNLSVYSLVTLTGFVLISFNYILDFMGRIFSKANIAARLDYWRTGLEIWKDNPIFGVGADQYRNFSALYRSSEQVIRDGNFVIPDKSHNIFIDHLANGGVFAGILWILLICLVFNASFHLIYHSETNRFQVATLISVWTCYVFQSIISPDQIVLSVVGYTSGGLLVALYNKNITASMVSLKFSYLQQYLTRFSFSIIILFMSIFYINTLSSNYNAQQIVTNKLVGRDINIRIINSWPNVKFTEQLAIESIDNPIDCSYSNKLTSRLIFIEERSAQGWFIKSICAYYSKDINLSLIFLNKSLEFDPFNVYYLATKAKIQISLNWITAAEETLLEARVINPNDPDLIQVTKDLDSWKTQIMDDLALF